LEGTVAPCNRAETQTYGLGRVRVAADLPRGGTVDDAAAGRFRSAGLLGRLDAVDFDHADGGSEPSGGARHSHPGEGGGHEHARVGMPVAPQALARRVVEVAGLAPIDRLQEGGISEGDRRRGDRGDPANWSESADMTKSRIGSLSV